MTTIAIDVEHDDPLVAELFTPTRLRDAAASMRSIGRRIPSKILYLVAKQLDSLTPPRPPEPTGLGAVVRIANSEFVRVASSRTGGLVWVREGSVDADDALNWGDLSVDIDSGYPLEVLFEGVTPDTGVDISSPWWQECLSTGGYGGCGHLDHTSRGGKRYGRKGAGA